MRIRSVVAVAVLVGAFGLAPPLEARAALPVVGPASLGMATYEPLGGGLSLTGSIAVGAGEFNGTATGHPSSFVPEAYAYGNLIEPFALDGPGLTGTCVGHWVLSPGGGVTEITTAGIPAGAASLSCTLQLGVAAPAETGLLVLLLPVGVSGYAGLFGPGTSSLTTPVPASLGTVDRFAGGDDTVYVQHDLVGSIALGGRTFKGHASGSYSYDPWLEPPPSFSLTGASPLADLAATCTRSYPQPGVPVDGVPVPFLFMELSCTGRVGSGPTGGTSLLLAIPISTYRYENPCGHCSTLDHTGIYVGT